MRKKSKHKRIILKDKNIVCAFSFTNFWFAKMIMEKIPKTYVLYVYSIITPGNTTPEILPILQYVSINRQQQYTRQYK